MNKAVSQRPTGSFRERLRQLGSEQYHHRHPFNVLMHRGLLGREDLKLWVANRYYYQTRIPIKDALILAKAEDSAFRRVWRRRLVDHDGGDDASTEPGGLELWRRLGHGVGLDPHDLVEQRALLPTVRRACDDYVELVQSSDLLTAVAASLTECFAPTLMRERIAAWQRHYPWVPSEALDYFQSRLTQAPADADFALGYVERHATTEATVERCLDAFAKKCQLLARLLDGVYWASRRERCPRLERRAVLTRAKGSDPDRHRHLLLAPERGVSLSQSAFELLERCDGATPLAQIARVLSERHRLCEERIAIDSAAFMGQLEARRLLCFQEPT